MTAIRTLATLCRCGLPLVEGRYGMPYAHASNPGAAHHYPKPLRASVGRSTTGGGAPRFGPAGLERPADVRRRTLASPGD